MKKIFIFFTLMFFASACCKKGVTTFVTDPEIINAGTFKDGTYLIYRDSVSGKEDSAWTTGFRKYKYPVKSTPTNKEDCYIIDYEEGYETAFLSTSSYKLRLTVMPYTINGFFEFGDFLNDNYINKHFNMTLKPFSGIFYPTFQLNGNTYENVYFNGDYENAIYFSTKSGIIKHSVKIDTSYVVKELIRSHIIK